jgi:acetoacetate decarboxylase
MSHRKLLFLLITLIILAGCSIRQGGTETANEPRSAAPVSTATPAPASFDVKNAETMLIIFVTPPGIAKNLVPAPLAPSPYNIMYVVVSRSAVPNDTGYYHTMELGVLAVFKGKMYTYPVYSVVDNKPMSEMGRMITGSPTRIGQITLEKKDKNLNASVEREGKILFKAMMVLGEPGDPLDSSPIVALKTIPAATKDGPPEVKQLISAKIENMKVHELIDGEATMEFDQLLTDGLPKVSVQQVYRAVYRKSDFTITSIGILHDYLQTD